MNKETFIHELKSNGNIDLTAFQIHQFETYIQLLQEWNQKMNLTSIIETDQIYEKHFYDSIMPFIDLSFSHCCDVGTGAGFPGIPLAIVYPDKKITLVEPIKKRCRFLQAVKEELELSIEIFNDRAEDFVKSHREEYEVVTSRAVARMTILLELCMPLVQVNGVFVALKGKNGHEELKNAKEALRILHGSLDHETIVNIDGAEHVNFYIKKEEHTPVKYPRVYGKIKKKPLGE